MQDCVQATMIALKTRDSCIVFQHAHPLMLGKYAPAPRLAKGKYTLLYPDLFDLDLVAFNQMKDHVLQKPHVPDAACFNGCD